MITDKLENAADYYGLSGKIQKGLEFLQNTDLQSYENGKYKIEGEKLFVSVQDYYTKSKEKGRFEAHRKYIDIQYLIKGNEKLGYTNLKNCTPVTPYDEEKDIIFLEGEGTFVEASEGDFLIFMPQDAHMPCISLKDSTYVKKAVVKILL